MMLRSWVAPMGLHIEPATARDADAVARLHAASFYRGWPRQDIEAYIIDPDTPTLVACDAKRKVVGFAMLRILGDDVELMTIAVEPKYRGKGLGRALLLKALAGFAAAGAARSFLEVTARNEPAVRVYRDVGFRCHKTLYRGVEVPEPAGVGAGL